MEAHRGRLNMEAMLERKPLHPAERHATPATVCVTGAAGFIGSRVVARLLACGHAVHATRRAAGDDRTMIAALDELPGACERLRWFEADLLEEGSFDAAVAGCRFVIHCAGVVNLNVPRGQGYARVIEPTVKGVENVLRAVGRAPAVERVVLTSSLAAVSGDFGDRGEGHSYNEADWNLSVLQGGSLGEPYFVAKVAAEWHAWAQAAQQERWRLVSICPGHVYGPLMAPSPKCGPVPAIKKLMNGSVYPFIAPLGVTPVDLDDVAAAHVLAMVLPQAKGRYILCERSALMTDMAAFLREAYPQHKVPYISLPFWFAVAFLWFTISYFWVKVLWNKQPAVDSGRAQWELGLRFIPLEMTLKAMMDSLIAHGILPAPASSPIQPALPKPPARAAAPARPARLAGTTATFTAQKPVAAKERFAVGEAAEEAGAKEGARRRSARLSRGGS